MPAPITRTFLGWREPALVGASRWLLDSAPHGDLHGCVVVTPGARARRMLIGALVEEAESRAIALTPPLVVTPGEIPGALLGPPGTPASRTARRLAWVGALRATEADALAPALPAPPAQDDFAGWSRIAGTFERTSDELAGEGLRFEDVPGRAGPGLPVEEAERWRALGAVQRGAASILADRGLVDEALAALDQSVGDGTVRAGVREVVLLAVPELNKVERLAIQRAAAPVTALIFAPASLADRFDDFGCVRAEAWGAAPVDLDDARVQFVDTPHDQAEAALAHLAAAAEPVDAGAVVIGVADPEVFARLRRRAQIAAGVAVRSPVGEPATRTLPGRLLTLLGAHLREPGFESLCALARHPDVEVALRARSAEAGHRDDGEWWLARLDAARREHVLLQGDAPPRGLHPRLREAVTFVSGGVADLLGDAFARGARTQALDAWADALGSALGAVYAGVSLRPDVDADRASIEALEAIRGGLDELAEAASGDAPDLAGWQAVDLLLERVEATPIPEAARRDAIETLGWLELALDPAPVCVVVGLADSCVPGSITHDALLPDSLRERLGLRTNRMRLARDAFLLSAIDASRDAVYFATRRGEEGDPRTPSRLLFRCTGETLARRVRRFARPELDARVHSRLAARLTPGGRDRFAPTLVIGAGYTPPDAMSVTEFGAYLRSPMGWYLERRLRRREHEAPRELSPMLFGSLAHAALESFGNDAADRKST
ncbi:MAG: PD-(D/E)XK nuclease family protein, partial [Phycisphaerales bacterium]